MKKIVFTSFMLVSLFGSSFTMYTPNRVSPTTKVEEATVADIFSYLKTGLALTSAQEAPVKKAVDETATTMTSLNKQAASATVTQKKQSAISAFISKVTPLLTATQATKLKGMNSTLLSMFSKL